MAASPQMLHLAGWISVWRAHICKTETSKQTEWSCCSCSVTLCLCIGEAPSLTLSRKYCIPCPLTLSSQVTGVCSSLLLHGWCYSTTALLFFLQVVPAVPAPLIGCLFEQNHWQMAFLLLNFHYSSLLIIAAYYGSRLAQHLIEMVRLSVSFIDSLSLTLPEIFFQTLTWIMGMEKKTKQAFSLWIIWWSVTGIICWL